MTPTQTTLLTHLAASLVGAAITYALLTANDPIPEPVAIKAIQAKERIRLRAEGAGFVRDSLKAVQSRISERPTRPKPMKQKVAEMAAERVNMADTLVGVKMVKRLKIWSDAYEHAHR